jgi:hypothetical protein
MDALTNPAVWACIILVLWPLSLVAGALLTRKNIRMLNEHAEAIDGDPRANEADRNWISRILDDALDWRPVALAVIMAPLFPIFALFAGIDMMIRRPKSTEEVAAESEMIRQRIDELEHVLATEFGRKPPSDGYFWNDPRREEMRDAVIPVSFLKNPILLVWLAIWGAPALAILLLTGAIKPTANFFRDQVWPLVYRWIGALSLLAGVSAYR